MIYLLYGSDDYRLSQKLKEIIGSLCFERIDLIESDEKVFWNYLNQSSLFISKKLLVIENAFSNPDFKKSFFKKTKDLSHSEHILIFVEKKEIKPTDSFLKILKENGKIQEFLVLSGKKLEDWAKNLFIQFGSNITEKALQNLLLFVGNDMWTLSNEIQKLSAFKKEITEKDIVLLVKPNIEVEIFKTIDALVSKNKKQALVSLQRYFDSGENLFKLLSMIAYQMRNLLMVKIAQSNNAISPKELGMHPYVFKKSADMVKNISVEQLKLSLQNVFLADLKIKTGITSPEKVIRSLVLSI
ncbi:MAG: DNA polymerase III subunit delta [bacterium]|nr:DNA polymerase III subunit delta [bacterium]